MMNELQQFAEDAYNPLCCGVPTLNYASRCFVGRKELVTAIDHLLDLSESPCLQHLRMLVGSHGEGKTTTVRLMEFKARHGERNWITASMGAPELELHPSATLHAASFVRTLLGRLRDGNDCPVSIEDLVYKAIANIEQQSAERGEEAIEQWDSQWKPYDLSVRRMMHHLFICGSHGFFSHNEQNDEQFELLCRWLSSDLDKVNYEGVVVSSLASNWQLMLAIYLRLTALAGYHGLLLLLDELDTAYENFSRRQNARLQQFIREVVDWPPEERPRDARLMFIFAVSPRWLNELTDYEALAARMLGMQGAPADKTPLWDLSDYPIMGDEWRKLCRHLLAINHLVGIRLKPRVRRVWIMTMTDFLSTVEYQSGLLRAVQQECMRTIAKLCNHGENFAKANLTQSLIAARLQVVINDSCNDN